MLSKRRQTLIDGERQIPNAREPRDARQVGATVLKGMAVTLTVGVLAHGIAKGGKPEASVERVGDSQTAPLTYNGLEKPEESPLSGAQKKPVVATAGQGAEDLIKQISPEAYRSTQTMHDDLIEAVESQAPNGILQEGAQYQVPEVAAPETPTPGSLPGLPHDPNIHVR